MNEPPPVVGVLQGQVGGHLIQSEEKQPIQMHANMCVTALAVTLQRVRTCV